MQAYKRLFTYWYSLIIYDLAVEFCSRWVKSYKLKEQMEGAARSGRQNIVEGSEIKGTSLKSSIKLTNVACASLEELIGDLEDFLRQRKLEQWRKDDPRVVVFRGKTAKIVKSCAQKAQVVGDLSVLSDLRGQLELPKNSEEAANFLLTLCHQATYLLSRQVKSLEEKHQKEGGYTEKLYRKRIEFRKKLS